MKRQNVRNALLLIAFLLMPITQFYFSPYIVMAAAVHGLVSGSLLVFAMLFWGSIFLGRAFCGWMMPCGGLQELCFRVNGRRVKGGWRNLVKFVIWVPWLIWIALSFVKVGGVHGVEPLYKIQHGISVSQPVMYIIYYGVILIVVSMAFIFGKRATCHYVCWIAPFMILGRKVRNVLKLPALCLKADPDRCRHCGQCTRECPMSLDVEGNVSNRRMENAECILCGRCVDGCPAKAIRFSFRRPEKSMATKKPIDISG